MTYLRMQGITRRFGDLVANDGIDLDVRRGEIHALVGENGAGKSTLMKILYGMEPMDAGRIFLEERPVSISNPQAAIRLGIGMVHQHFQLVPSLTVAENIALGYEPRRGLFADRARMVERVRALSDEFGLQVEPLARVADLSVGVQQRIEILKLLYRDAQLLILDEPSAVLTPQEVDDLFAVLRRLVAQGRTAIFITHKMRELMAISQRITALRRGRVVGTLATADASPARVAAMMVGHDIEALAKPTTAPALAAPPRLVVRSVSASDERGLPALRNVSFSLCAGEILGVAGVEGNGQRELTEVIVGLRKPDAGDIALDGQDVTRLKGRRRRERGLAVIPEDRQHQGLSQPMTVLDNLISTRYYSDNLSRLGVLKAGRVRQFAAELISRFDIRTPGAETPVKTLSGGNAQKVVVARELASQPSVLIAAQPTRGLDIAAARFVQAGLLRLRESGTAVLLISADLDELLALSDRILVLFEGRVIGETDASSATREKLGLLMAGRAAHEQSVNAAAQG